MITVHKMHLGVEIHAKRAARTGLEINQELLNLFDRIT